jgi:hypothetical protein
MLKFKTLPDNFNQDSFFCNLSKGVFRDYGSGSINDEDIIDSLSKTFFVYKVEFEQSASGRAADSILTNSNIFTGYLIPKRVERGAVTHYILQRWRGKFDFVRYTVTNQDCNEEKQCCIVRIGSIK